MEIARLVDDVLAEPPRRSVGELLDAALRVPESFQSTMDADPERARAVLELLDAEIMRVIGAHFSAIIDGSHTGRERSPLMIERQARALARALAGWPAVLRPALLRAVDAADRAPYDNTYGSWEAGWIRTAIHKRLGVESMMPDKEEQRMRYSRALEPVDAEGRYYHVRCTREEMAPTVLLPGDPARVGRISQHWTVAREVANYRHYVVHTGQIGAIPVTAVSTGTGAPSMVMVVEEAARLGATTLIRVGTCGAIQPGIALGDVVISTAAVRLDGATRDYVRPEYPAAAHYEVVLALIEAAEALGITYHLGVTASTDTWYIGQGRPGVRGYMPSHMLSLIDDLRAAGVVNFEMDSSGLLTLGGLFGLRAGVVCAVYANRIEDTFAMVGEDRAVAVANKAVEILHRMDAERASRGRRHWFPSLRE